MSDERATVDFEEVRLQEKADIQQRRRSHSLPESNDDLVGLSLSGGGLRSASFCMGFIQALHARRVWKWVDYLSTVSGGGYIGGYISSSTVQQQSSALDRFPLAVSRSNRQPASVLRFIYGGRHLLNTWELANKYLIGLLFVNLAIFSAMIAGGALIAFLWRLFDSHWFRERADMIDLHTDLYAAFFPFVLCMGGWLLAWILSYYRRGAEAPGKVARVLLYATVASFVIGLALLMGNGDILLPIWASDSSTADSLVVSRTWWGSIVGLILGTLIPLIKPKQLILSGTQPKNQFERITFAAVTTGMLIGVPLVIIGTLAQENISGYSDSVNRPFVRQDSDDLMGLAVLLGADPSKSATWGEWPQPLPESLRHIKDNRSSETLEVQAVNLQLAANARAEADRRFKKTDEFCENVVFHYAGRLYRIAGWLAGQSESENPATAFLAAKQSEFRSADMLCSAIDRELLPSRELYAYLREKTAPTTPPALAAISASLAIAPMALPVKSDSPASVHDHQIKDLNRQMLEKLYPKVFRKRTEIRRAVCIGADQEQRLWIFGIALGVLVMSGMWVDLNATSLHGYYRNRLARLFVVSKNRKSASIALSDLNTTDFGEPYHLMNASVGWFRRQFDCTDERHAEDNSDDGNRAGTARSEGRRARSSGARWSGVDVVTSSWVDSFLFSRRYCGADATGYLATPEYEGRIHGELNRVDLAEAIALSGGALTPGQVRNLFVAMVMFGLNLRLGQWLPNPGQRAPRSRPSFLALAMGLLRKPEQRRYCFVADGGHCENLGVLALLRRRCRLIIAVDAGQDPDHCFDDLARALRDARLHDGITVTPLGSDPEAWPDGLQTCPLNLKKRDGSAVAESERHFLLARIHYPDGASGLFVYVKPSMDGDEPVELLQYRARNGQFPHETTTDQLFEPHQVESYRQLGNHIGNQLLGRIRDFKNVQELCQHFEQVNEKAAASVEAGNESPECSPSIMLVEAFAEPTHWSDQVHEPSPAQPEATTATMKTVVESTTVIVSTENVTTSLLDPPAPAIQEAATEHPTVGITGKVKKAK